MGTSTDIKHIVRDAGIYGGKPRIAGHRVAVHDIAVCHNAGYAPEQIVRELYPTLTLPEVYAALLYYYEHKDDIDAEVAAEDAEVRAQAAADTSPLAKKIQTMRKERQRASGTP